MSQEPEEKKYFVLIKKVQCYGVPMMAVDEGAAQRKALMHVCKDEQEWALKGVKCEFEVELYNEENPQLKIIRNGGDHTFYHVGDIDYEGVDEGEWELCTT